jgi:hypothetical protein
MLSGLVEHVLDGSLVNTNEFLQHESDTTPYIKTTGLWFDEMNQI